ncbi:MAG: hypothetical protein R2844_08185 [Caldilineales bacterium]
MRGAGIAGRSADVPQRRSLHSGQAIAPAQTKRQPGSPRRGGDQRDAAQTDDRQQEPALPAAAMPGLADQIQHQRGQQRGQQIRMSRQPVGAQPALPVGHQHADATYRRIQVQFAQHPEAQIGLVDELGDADQRLDGDDDASGQTNDGRSLTRNR